MKSSLVFLKVPPNFPKQLKGGSLRDDDVFLINSDIPIPVEISGEIDFADLTMDMILAGMLRAIEERQAKQEWIDYYSAFVLFLRPDIITKLNEMKDMGLAEESYLNAYKFVRDGKAEEGLASIRDFLEDYPGSWNGWFILGWALRLLGRWQDALAALKKAIELGGDYSNTRNELAICKMEMADYAGAKQELEIAIKDDPENVTIISNLGVLALKTGYENEAASYFKKVLELDEDDPVA
ncbi:MAG: tetratricopeptide repeat protein [Treponema sp.]|nr:tetratricopeptide repeat protein [Treponema sp.]